MATVRVYFNNQRLATGKPWKEGFLQVYPVLKEFPSETAWRGIWESVLGTTGRFEVQGPSAKVVAALTVPLPPSPPPTRTQTGPTADGWTFKPVTYFTAPPGKYYIGDLCYALTQEIYDGVFGGQDYECGLYTKGTSFFLVDHTAFGDGCYKDSYGRDYLVDAGIIGICSEDLIDLESPSLYGGHIITVHGDELDCSFGGGLFKFRHGFQRFIVNTVGDDEDADDEGEE